MLTDKPAVLIVDDDMGIRDTLEAILKDDCDVIKAGTGAEARRVLEERYIKIVLLDLRLPDCHGLEILKEIKERFPTDVEVVVITAVRDLETGIKALKLGAYDYLTKSFDYDEVLALVRRVLEKQRSEKERLCLRSEIEQRVGTTDFILGKSSVMQDLNRLVQKVAKLQTTVLVLGETGTGK
ncbi:MAG: sigma-54-dependent Fis family transcriptional regulator, partial [Nitrospirae bacterium]|nr:sigma-54-dependent Fis family transcriptional regulator [Nitrospirota bacterium]